MKMKSFFTLIELLIVIVIISILSAIVIPNISEFTKKATVTALEVEARSIETAVDLYEMENGEYPTVDKLPVTEDTPNRLVNGTYLKAKEVSVEELLTSNYLKKAPSKKETKYYLVLGGDVVWEYKDFAKINNLQNKVAIDENGDGFPEGFDTNEDGKIDIINFDNWLAAHIWYETYDKVFPNKTKEDFFIDYPTYADILKFAEENPITIEQASYVEYLEVTQIEMIMHLNGLQYLKNLKSFKGSSNPAAIINTSIEMFQPLLSLANDSTVLTEFYILNVSDKYGYLIKERLSGQFNNLTDGGIGSLDKVYATYQDLNK